MPRGSALGMVSHLSEEDSYSMSRAQIYAYIDVCMGGRVAEELVYGADQVRLPVLVVGLPVSMQKGGLPRCVSCACSDMHSWA